MNIFFDPIEKEDVKKFFNGFFHENAIFFEIVKFSKGIGFYAIENITDKICEISIYINERDRNKITKELAKKCLKFPSLLGFNKTFIRTELKKMYRFLCKMVKYGVNYLFQHNRTYWFEVNYGT